MKFLRGLALLGIVVFATGAVSAQGLLGKIKKGAGKAGAAVSGAAENVGNSIGSTVDLAKDDEPPAEIRAKLDAMAAASLSRLFAENPAAGTLFDASMGYAVFDTRKIGALGVSAGFGRGVAVSQADARRIYMNMGTGGLGLSFGIGGFESQVVILFETAGGFAAFITDGYDATAQAGSMFGDEKTGEAVRFVDGRSIFVLDKKGWKVSATAAGTKYWPDPDLN
jgi:hypothetical protein